MRNRERGREGLEKALGKGQNAVEIETVEERGNSPAKCGDMVSVARVALGMRYVTVKPLLTLVRSCVGIVMEIFTEVNVAGKARIVKSL